mgnify:CR=1 FL=1
MPNDRQRAARSAAAAAALVLVFAATYIVLDRTERRPAWLTVEAPAAAVVGRPFEVRVALDGSVERTRLACTLHRANAEKRGWGYLASSGPPREAAGGSVHTFAFDVPEREETAYAFALVYLSPTGKWPDGTRAVATDLVPVSSDGPGATVPPPAKVRLRPYPTAAQSAAWRAAGRRERPRPSAWVHPVLSLILLAAAGLAATAAAKRKPGGPGDGGWERRVWLAFAAVLALGAFLENSGMAGDLAAWGRGLAREQGFYELRRPYQKALTAAVAAAGLGLFLLFLKAVRRPGQHRFPWWAGLGLAAYLSLSFVSVLSFHAVDRLREVMWQGVSPVDAARGTAALVTLAAAAFALRRGDGPPAT